MTPDDPSLFPEPERIRTWEQFVKSGGMGKWTRKPKRGRSNAETQFNAACRKLLEGMGAWCWRCNSGTVRTERGYWVVLAPKGTPDTIGEFNGRPLAVEGKVDAELTDKQAAWGRKAIRRGWLYAVVRPSTVHQLQELLASGEIQKETLAELDRVG